MVSTNLLTDVETALGTAMALGYAKKAKQHDLYEAYVLTLLLKAAEDTGWSWVLQDGWGNAVASPIFRMGPGRLTSRGFTFARLTRADKQPLEAHLGVKVAGTTSVRKSTATPSGRLLHEFDLLMLKASDATKCRTTNSDPDHSAVVLHGEMKYYQGKLSLPLGRAAVGMAIECVLHNRSVLVTNRLGLTVQDLVEHHRVRFRFLVKPSNTIGEYHLKTWFKGALHQAP
jgi:hypothetical protein